MEAEKKDAEGEKEEHKETEKKDKKYSFRKEEKKKNTLRQKKNQIWVYAIIIVLAAFIVISSGLFDENQISDAENISSDGSLSDETDQLLEEKLAVCNSHLAVNDYDNSIICLNEALTIKEDARAYKALAEIYTILGDENRSIDNQKLAAETAMDDDEFWYTLALMLERAGRMDEAREAYQKVIDANPEHAEARNNLGIIFQKNGMLNESRQEFEAALAVSPNASVIVLNYANLLAELGENGLADENFRRAIALDNESKTAYRNYAQFLYNNGNYIDAKANLEKSY